mmetsp:Transcript_35638/g.93532  ORF Transcript_35638/g.93532 Transcript_35638/m.93532 type:complete len:285 (-) Transcript_35638:166-1020(-)
MQSEQRACAVLHYPEKIRGAVMRSPTRAGASPRGGVGRGERSGGGRHGQRGGPVRLGGRRLGRAGHGNAGGPGRRERRRGWHSGRRRGRRWRRRGRRRREGSEMRRSGWRGGRRRVVAAAGGAGGGKPNRALTELTKTRVAGLQQRRCGGGLHLDATLRISPRARTTGLPSRTACQFPPCRCHSDEKKERENTSFVTGGRGWLSDVQRGRNVVLHWGRSTSCCLEKLYILLSRERLSVSRGKQPAKLQPFEEECVPYAGETSCVFKFQLSMDEGGEPVFVTAGT